MTAALIDLIEEKLYLDWNPEQVSGWLVTENSVLISHERIYQHAWKDKRQGEELYKHLRRQGKKYDKRRNGKSTRGQIKNQISIDERPQIVDDTNRIGDWEIDTVIGKNQLGAIINVADVNNIYDCCASSLQAS
jgi:IS30 family transposase